MTVSVVAAFVRGAVAHSPHDLTQEERDELVRRGVEFIMARGARVVGDELVLRPAN